MSCGIYCYIDKKDDSIVYVGKDSNIDKEVRHKAHYASYRYNEQHINRVLQNNPNRYTYQVLAWNVTDNDTLSALETSYITHLKPMFNFTDGGDGLSGYNHTNESKEKISLATKGENNPFYGKNHSDKIKKQISKSKNSTGFYRVTKHNNKECKQGFRWMYRYFNNKKQKAIVSTDLNKLKQKVLAKNLEWCIIDEEKAQKTLDSLKNE